MCYIIQVEKNQQHVGFIMYYFFKMTKIRNKMITNFEAARRKGMKIGVVRNYVIFCYF